MTRGDTRWVWGLDLDGATWLTVASKWAIRIEPDEIGPSLQAVSDVYSLELESLLNNVLKNCRLTPSAGSESTHVITATPGRQWRKRVRVREMIIECDRETRAIRRLVVKRELPQHGSATTTFTLVECALRMNLVIGPKDTWPLRTRSCRDSPTIIGAAKSSRTGSVLKWIAGSSRRLGSRTRTGNLRTQARIQTMRTKPLRLLVAFIFVAIQAGLAQGALRRCLPAVRQERRREGHAGRTPRQGDIRTFRSEQGRRDHAGGIQPGRGRRGSSRARQA